MGLELNLLQLFTVRINIGIGSFSILRMALVVWAGLKRVFLLTIGPTPVIFIHSGKGLKDEF